MKKTHEETSKVIEVPPHLRKYLKKEDKKGPQKIMDRGSSKFTVKNQDQWTNDDSAELYGVRDWGAGYFDINEAGHAVAFANDQDRERNIDIYELTQDLLERGIRLPILIRFMDIIEARVRLVNECFQRAIDEYGYNNRYQGVYPIKVNQQKHLVEKILTSGEQFKTGLECGSKPELLVALAMMSQSNGLLICNGFKDSEYIETAILSQKLGFETIIVVEKLSDLDLILETSKKLNTNPRIGIRAKLDSRVTGKWAETSGPRSKFGLCATEIMTCVDRLEELNMMDCLQLLHFHIGSQIPNIQSIKSSIKEGARFYTELQKLGAKIKYLDVGGGLGVDYDGTGGGDSSINYSEQEYANDVVSIIQNICDEKEAPHPTIVSESGRSLTAHHSLLVFNVLGSSEQIARSKVEKPKKGNHILITELYEIYEKLNKNNLVESFNDLMQYKTDVAQLFSYGILNLKKRAFAESLIKAITEKMLPLATEEEEEEIIETLETDLLATYYANFSVFQSVPDSWAVNQVFPVMPIHRLNEKPEKKGVLVDLTCDCDGKIDRFIQEGETKSSIALHRLPSSNQESYYLGTFMLGAYQEILGDLHNLFGDTDAVSVSIDESGYHIDEVEEGDTVGEILGYIQYHRADLIQKIRQSIESSIKNGTMQKSDARLLMRNYEEGLAGYSYLEEPHF